MKKNEFLEMYILSPNTYLTTDGIFPVIQMQYDLLPAYRPQKWDWTEPLKKPFDINQMEEISHDGAFDRFLWKKTGKDRADGRLSMRWGKDEDVRKNHHASFSMTVHSIRHESQLMDALKKLSELVQTDYAFFDAFTERYRPYAMASEVAPYGAGLWASTHVLRHWLPDMMWATVFGKPYVDMFGRARVLSTPAYKVEELTPDIIFIQLTPSMNCLFERFDEVMAAREIAKQYLGYEHFFQKDLGYFWKGQQEKAGQVFKVPEFVMYDPEGRAILPQENPVAPKDAGPPVHLEPVRPVLSYDNAGWHYGSEGFPQFLAPEQGAVHIGMFIAWCIKNGWFAEKDWDMMEKVKSRQMTGTEFVMEAHGEKFYSDMLTDEIQPFVNDYYSDESSEFAKAHGSYFDDYAGLLDTLEPVTGKIPKEMLQNISMEHDKLAIYRVKDNWENYDLIASVISQRYSEWQAFPDKAE